MCYWTIRLIKVNVLNLRTPIFKVACRKFPCIRIAVLLNTWCNEWVGDLYSTRDIFDQYRSGKKVNIFLSYCKNKASFPYCFWGTLRASPMFLGVRWFSGRRTSRCETTDLTWSPYGPNTPKIYIMVAFYSLLTAPDLGFTTHRWSSSSSNLAVTGSYPLIEIIHKFFISCVVSWWPYGEFGIVSRI